MKRYVQPYLPYNREQKPAGICRHCSRVIYKSEIGLWYHYKEGGSRLCYGVNPSHAEPNLFLDYFNELTNVSNTKISSR
jgi:hypothetical protein